MNLNISITANTSWYLYNFRKNTITSLIAQGHNVYVFAPRDDYTDLLIELGVSFRHLPIDSGGTNPINDLWTLCCFIKLFLTNKVDVSLNFTPKNNIYGSIAAKVCKVKVINNIAGLGLLFGTESLASKIARGLYKFSQRYSHFIFFQNEDDRSLFLKHKIANSCKTDRLPGSGVDLNRFKYSPIRKGRVIKFILVARMLQNKGIYHYVEAARFFKKKYNQHVEFRMLGFLDVNNPLAVSSEQMNSWCNEGIVTYLGISDNVEKEITDADCVVLPSFYREGVPKSLLEAGAIGRPIITTDSVGCRETVDDGVNGFLCEPRSTESLIVALQKFIDLEHQTRLLFGENSRKKIATDFDEKIVIQKYFSAIEQVCKN